MARAVGTGKARADETNDDTFIVTKDDIAKATGIVDRYLPDTFVAHLGVSEDDRDYYRDKLINLIAERNWDKLSSFIRIKKVDIYDNRVRPSDRTIRKPTIDDRRQVEDILKRVIPAYRRYIQLKVWSKVTRETKKAGGRVRFPEGTRRGPSTVDIDLTGDDTDDLVDNPTLAAWAEVNAISREKRRSAKERLDLDDDEPSAMRGGRKRDRDDDGDEMMA